MPDRYVKKSKGLSQFVCVFYSSCPKTNQYICREITHVWSYQYARASTAKRTFGKHQVLTAAKDWLQGQRMQYLVLGFPLINTSVRG
jgi:hypothetical protein